MLKNLSDLDGLLAHFSDVNIKLSEKDLPQGSYLALLRAVEKQLPLWLEDETLWQTVDVDYHPPRVERVWMSYGALRICLHRIHPAKPSETLFHPHPWPSAMWILKGQYEMGLGAGTANTKPPITATILLQEGNSYEMIHPEGWHYVCPVQNVTYSLMVSGRPWDDTPASLPKKLESLTKEAKEEIVAFFKNATKISKFVF